MNANTIIDSIKSKLNAGHYNSEADDINEYITDRSAEEEKLATVGRHLVDLQFNDPQAYYLIEDDIDDYLKYCESEGIIIL